MAQGNNRGKMRQYHTALISENLCLNLEPELCSDPTVNSLRSSFQNDIFEPELDDKFRALRRVSPEMRAEMLNLERNCGIRTREGKQKSQLQQNALLITVIGAGDVENSPEAQDKDADLLNALGQNGTVIMNVESRISLICAHH